MEKETLNYSSMLFIHFSWISHKFSRRLLCYWKLWIIHGKRSFIEWKLLWAADRLIHLWYETEVSIDTPVKFALSFDSSSLLKKVECNILIAWVLFQWCFTKFQNACSAMLDETDNFLKLYTMVVVKLHLKHLSIFEMIVFTHWSCMFD